jgi:hypothetical protein
MEAPHMNDPRKNIQALNAAFTHKHDSLAGYVLDARPHVRAEQQPALEAIRAIAAADREEATRLSAQIEQLDGVAQSAGYDPQVAEWNYLSLDYLLRELAARLEAQAGQLTALSRRNGLDRGVIQTLERLTSQSIAQIETLRRFLP